MSKETCIEIEKSKLNLADNQEIQNSNFLGSNYAEAETKPGSAFKMSGKSPEISEKHKIEDPNALILIIRKLATNPKELNNL